MLDIWGDLKSLLGDAGSFQHRPGQYPALHGVRALLSIWMILFHCYYYYGAQVPEPQIKAFEASNRWVHVVTQGISNVDVFFVLTGLLIAYPLLKLPASETSKLSLRATYWKRFVVRIFPVYLITMLLHIWVLFPKGLMPLSHLQSDHIRSLILEQDPQATHAPTSCWTFPINLLFLNNFWPFGGCMGFTWSLAVQGQFYLLFPLLVKKLSNGRSLLITCIIFVLLGITSRVLTWYTFEDWLVSDPSLFPYTKHDFERFFVQFFFFYGSTFQRMGALFLGALLAILQRDVEQRAAWTIDFAQRYEAMFSWLPSLLRPDSWLAAACFKVLYERSRWRPTMWFNAFLMVGGNFWSFCVCIVLFLMINRIGVIGRLLDAAFSARVWYPLSMLSYGTYLLHPQLQTWLSNTWFYPPVMDRAQLAEYALVAVSLTYLGALVLYVLIEQPCARWLGRMGPGASSSRKIHVAAAPAGDKSRASTSRKLD